MDLSMADREDTQSMAELQTRGIAAIYNFLCDQRYAYLADEVGMGKTYQALGVAALVWNTKPDARILFVCPREVLQGKWKSDYQRFFASNYRRGEQSGDDRVTSVLFGKPLHRPETFENLRSWLPSIGMAERLAPILRHTSFMRPVFVTRRDFADMGALRQKIGERFRSWGLFDVDIPEGLTPDTASYELNMSFAKAMNHRLERESSGTPYFDLVIVDEAQCLRNPKNQTNQVFFESLKGQVDRWLFLSATPAHGGPGDLPTILNHYPGCGTVIDESLTDDLPKLQEQLKSFMVRRQRTYALKNNDGFVSKSEYRSHDPNAWAISEGEMDALESLSMGLVQKGLVDALEGENNRFRVGKLSSFETLQSSLRRRAERRTGEAENNLSDDDDNDVDTCSDKDEDGGDWYRDADDRGGQDEAPDDRFLARISRDFEKQFGASLPHPKVSSVVDRVADLAFGTSRLPGGTKFLIFARRVSTVNTLEARLTKRYLRSIERRIRESWGVDLDWSGESHTLDAAKHDEDMLEEDSEGDDGARGFPHDDAETGNLLRAAMSEGSWLYKFRRRFRKRGSLGLFFEDGWLQRLCQAGGVTPEEACENISDRLWGESLAHARSNSGDRVQTIKRDRLRYLAVHALDREPGAFGLTKNQASPWRKAYRDVLHDHKTRAEPVDDPSRDLSLLQGHTLWTRWDEHFRGTPIELPATDVDETSNPEKFTDELCKRSVAQQLLEQTFRLTDVLLDLYFANQQAEADPARDLSAVFLDWLASDNVDARRVRSDCANWLKHLRIIVDSSLDGAGKGWSELARRARWSQLDRPRPVYAVAGSSSVGKTATEQFRTPSLPRVIVCTDTLKEGVDLHLFCDRVIHYGVAWTAGDMEQRVGRVDRYFSQIERRLANEGCPPDVVLEVAYPHVASSIEDRQVSAVIARQKKAETLMNSPLGGSGGGVDEINTDTSSAARRARRARLQDWAEPRFPDSVAPILGASKEECQDVIDHYSHWYRALCGELRGRGWIVESESKHPDETFDIIRNGDQRDVQWSFDAPLKRYLLTLSNPLVDEAKQFSGGVRRRKVKTVLKNDRFIRLLVPSPEDVAVPASSDFTGDPSIARFSSILEREPPAPMSDARERWGRVLENLAEAEVEWLKPHKAALTVQRDERRQQVMLYAYENGVRIIGTVAQIEELPSHHRWDGDATHKDVRAWTHLKNNKFSLGYLDVHERDGLVFGIHIMHGTLSDTLKKSLVREVAHRADIWEAALTGQDRW
jgi:hypothetical protein